jgi:hypothetical protein
MSYIQLPGFSSIRYTLQQGDIDEETQVTIGQRLASKVSTRIHLLREKDPRYRRFGGTSKSR